MGISESVIDVTGNFDVHFPYFSMKLSARESTALIKGKRFCRKCKDEMHPKSGAEFQDSDAKFKCRAESCGAEKLSLRETLIGSCCKDALMKQPDSISCNDLERRSK